MARSRRGDPRALDHVGILRGTAIGLASDHGGHNHSHGTEVREDVTVSWVSAGPGIAKGCRSAYPLGIRDTASSLLPQLDIVRSLQWLKQVMRQAFAAQEQGRGPLVSQPLRGNL